MVRLIPSGRLSIGVRTQPALWIFLVGSQYDGRHFQRGYQSLESFTGAQLRLRTLGRKLRQILRKQNCQK